VAAVAGSLCLRNLMADTDRLFSHGSPNREHFGFISIRSSAGGEPDPGRIDIAARILGRVPFYKDDDGCEHEIIGAAISETGRLAYVESQTKDGGASPHGFDGRHIDVSIRIHFLRSEGTDCSVEIESYNPFFGCDIRFFEWIGETVVLIYREKHWTFAYRFGDVWPPRFFKIEHDWLIHDNQLAYIGYKQDSVQRLSFPALDPLDPLPKEEAVKRNLMPETHWT
jgi:hypothetical protein